MLPKTDTLKFAVLAAYLFLTADLSGQRAGFRDTIAGIPVNYDEQKVGIYTLPDLFRTHDGGKVKTPEEWFMKRRPEILDDFRENQFGFAPGRPEDMWFDVFDPGTPALNGMAVRKQVCVYFTGDTAGSKMDLLIYLPADANGPFPLLMGLNFVPNCSYIDDPGIRKGEMWGRDHTKVPAPERSRFSYFDPTLFLSRGIAYASVYYGDIEPDFSEGIPYGIRGAYLKPGETEPGANGWGAIAAWAWGLSRAMDYLETDPDINHRKIAIMGASRLGKTVLWAGATDQRFAMVIACCSGEGGAALSRRRYGETIAHLTAPSRYPYQFCTNYQKYAEDVEHFPVDAHMLVALMAPSPLLLQTGITDYWSDPKGEFLAAMAAGPVYELLGAQSLGISDLPEAGQPVLHTLGFLMHDGGHGILPSDYPVFIEFIQKYLMSNP